jgi:hypothetical protein
MKVCNYVNFKLQKVGWLFKQVKCLNNMMNFYQQEERKLKNNFINNSTNAEDTKIIHRAKVYNHTINIIAGHYVYHAIKNICFTSA